MEARIEARNKRIRDQFFQRLQDRRSGNSNVALFTKHENITGNVVRESLERAAVEENLKKRAEDFPKKMVLVVDPDTGKHMYVERKERESNAFITLNTHQRPIINENEREMEAVLKLVINKLFSETEMQRWVEIKEPCKSQGDKFTLDPAPETSIFKSMKILPGIEIGPINGMLHAHIIVELSHFSLLRYNSETFGRRAAELWRDIVPADLRPEPQFDISVGEIIDAVKEEQSVPGAIKKDFDIDNAALYAGYPDDDLNANGIPKNRQDRRGLHKIATVNKIRAFIKSRPLLRNIAAKRVDMEKQCRQYIIEHMAHLETERGNICHFTKSMYCNIQITQSNSVNHRMNYIQKTQATGGEA